MTLIFNLPGAVQEVRKATTNREAVDALNRLTEEFFKTIGTVLFTRLAGIIRDDVGLKPHDLVNLLRNHFETPSFEAWEQLQSVCADHLIGRGDHITTGFAQVMKSPIPDERRSAARAVLSAIHNLRSARAYKPPRHPTYSRVMGAMRSLRNFKAHEYDSNVMYEPLMTAGTKTLIPELIEELMDKFNIQLLVPLEITKNHAKTAIITGTKCDVIDLPPLSHYERFTGECYLQYDNNEDPFRFHTDLVRYDLESNRCYVYVRCKNNCTIYESVPPTGGVDKWVADDSSLTRIFDVATEEESETLTEQLREKFGKIHDEAGLIHNLPQRYADYVGRRECEEDVYNKLSHKRDWITTVAGGGGVGKTELSKEVVWRLIEDDRESTAGNLKFDTLVWLTAKEEILIRGVVHRKEHTFKKAEDLTDSILYVTGNPEATRSRRDAKKELVIKALNERSNTLLFIDNLETLKSQELNRIEEFLDFLGDNVQSGLKVLLTSRVDYEQASKLIIVKEMKDEEAEILLTREMKAKGVSSQWFAADIMNRTLKVARNIPLLIRHCVDLISFGHSLEEMELFDPQDKENPWREVLDFMCNLQWNDLSDDSKYLLTAIAFWGGSISFHDAMVLCEFNETQFTRARSELFKRSFLVRSDLILSKLTVLAPIADFARIRLTTLPEYEEQFYDRESLLKGPDEAVTVSLDDLSDDVALNYYHQRAEAFARSGSIENGYKWCKESTKRFKTNPSAWRNQGEYEFRYLNDEAKGRESFKTAIKLNPDNPRIYTDWAYWEHQIGVNQYSKLSLQRSMKLNQEALKRTESEYDKKRITDFIASAQMKMAYIARDEYIRAPSRDAEYDRDYLFRNTILLLESNLYDNPKDNKRIQHNIIDYTMLATAFLSMGRRGGMRTLLDDCALYYLAQGLRLSRYNKQLRYAARHRGAIKALNRKGIRVSRDDTERLVSQILANENEFKTARKKVDSFLKEIGSMRRWSG